MQTLNPSETFPICRQLRNHLETDTLYVRAVIKNAINDTVLATVDLDDKGSYYFRYNWKVVWDNTMARGRYITITVSIYSDSGYTTKHQSYGDEIDTYLVQERWDAAKMQSMGGGGNYNGITAKDVRKVITEEIKKIKFPKQEKLKEIKFPKQIEYIRNFDEMYEELQDIKARVGSLPAQNNDLSPLLSKLDALSKELKTKPVTPITDLKPIKEMLSDLNSDRKINKKELKDILTKLEKSLTETLNKAIPNAMSKANYTIPLKNLTMTQPEEKKEEKPKEDILRINKLKSKFGIK